ncbi:quinone oxidoreductase family protein [Burkholderia sp. AU38729]|uniref:quinone oxidoreductase family protein n=1 Tax=Burkholderia sp. AU38729 TaxID=2879633 RepID=UPI001CF2D30C|nr:zinc-binding alcohol dehydrogenase family protein [Burkholderia sp. AU38729]MCA8061410.1 zinc-binding alcohol dehydrogenase family protein [Burkholderia sp. AU38729]
MRRVRVLESSNDVNTLRLEVETQSLPETNDSECIVEIVSAGVDPSDVNALLGLMQHAVWPRTPGRDYAGRVIDGPPALVGRSVWGSGADLGIRRDGTHARYLAIPLHSVREKPANLTLDEAGTVGVPFVTAFEGFRRAGGVNKGDVVLVIGANGIVGQAAIQLATMVGATTVAAERAAPAYLGHANNKVRMIDASSSDFEAMVRDVTHGHGADIVFNAIGSPYFEQANLVMAAGGAQIFISTAEGTVPFDISTFYRDQHSYVGANTLGLDARKSAVILDKLLPAFERGALRPFPIHDDYMFDLDDAVRAYRTACAGAAYRTLLKP